MLQDSDKEYKIKDIANLLDVSVKTIKNWEQKGYLPNPRRNKWGWRVYSEKEKELVMATVKEQDYFRQRSH